MEAGERRYRQHRYDRVIELNEVKNQDATSLKQFLKELGKDL